MSKGLKINEITQFTFTNGVVVGIRRVSPFLAIDLQEKFPPPEPPLEEVDFGDGKKRFEANPTAAQYLKDMTKYRVDFEKKMRRLIIKRGVVITIDETIKAQLKELREFYTEEYGSDPESYGDVVDYVIYIAVTEAEDLNNLINAILGRSQPTQEGIKKVVDSFPGDVSGS